MMKTGQAGISEAMGRQTAGPVLRVSNRSTPRCSVVSMGAPQAGPQLVPFPPRIKVMGRKGRQTLARRRAMDGAFLGVALVTVVLVWWSTL